MGEALLDASQRVLYVASSDLSHRLMPEAPAGFDPRGAEFDRRWPTTFAAGDWEALLSIDPGLADGGRRVWLPVVGRAVGSGGGSRRRRAARRSNHLLSYEGPFGVGYLVGEVEISEIRGGVQ